MSAKAEIKPIQEVIMIGTGNVARHLGEAFFQKGIKIKQVYGRNPDKAKKLANQWNSIPVSDIRQLLPSEFYFFCLSDAGFMEQTQGLSLNPGITVHVSGSLPISALSGLSNNNGVFYPLQTFSSDHPVNFNEVPILIEGSDDEVINRLIGLATQISKEVKTVNSEQRFLLHIAAVFACNFTNYMYFIAEKILEENNLDFNLLKPLIKETATKAMHYKPGDVQTGPAKRKDHEIIRKHLEKLGNNKDFQEVYKLLSGKIEDHFNI
ncbi:MAG: DUF2520 domain-containing protein [Bacteroidetes bacterium]|nr:DUF2520 domain-containing protein [Bacteroidota bacterium]